MVSQTPPPAIHAKAHKRLQPKIVDNAGRLELPTWHLGSNGKWYIYCDDTCWYQPNELPPPEVYADHDACDQEEDSADKQICYTILLVRLESKKSQ